jgi:hypothetical protein
MNVEIGTETPIFLLWEYFFQIFAILSLQCMSCTPLFVEESEAKALLLETAFPNCHCLALWVYQLMNLDWGGGGGG